MKKEGEMMQVSLKAARVNAGMSQKEAAKMIGVSNKTLCNWEKGVSYPSADKIRAYRGRSVTMNVYPGLDTGTYDQRFYPPDDPNSSFHS